MPLFDPPLPATAIPNLQLIQVDPDPSGDWTRIGNGLWFRLLTEQPGPGTVRYAMQVRLESGAIRYVGFSDWPGP